MQTLKCPHCGKGIDLLSAGDMSEEYGITPNVLQHARETGNFPEPVLSFGNRNIFMRREIEAYAEERARAKTDKIVADLDSLLAQLPEEERQHALSKLQRTEPDNPGNVDGGSRSRARSRATR